MTPLLPQLLLGSAFILGSTAVAVGAALHDRRQRQHLRHRLGLVTGPYMRRNPVVPLDRPPPARPATMARVITAAARLFGYDPRRAGQYPFRWWVVLGVALSLARALAGMAGLFIGHWALLVIPPAWVMLSRFAFHWSDQRRRDALYAQFPDALGMIVRAVRVGIPPGEGIRTVAREAAAPTRLEFALLHDRISIGTTLEDALRELADRNDLAEYRFFATALALQSQTGGGLTETLETLAEVIRRRLALRARGLALAAEAKTSIMVLAGLPFVSGGALGVLNPAYVSRFLTDPDCQKVLLAAIVLLCSGLLTMHIMIRKALS